MSVKQTNFRIDEKTADNFRKFCKENGMNQTAGFDHIMQIVELNNAKSSIQNRQTEIEEFELHAKSLISSYLHSLEINNNAEMRVKEQFEAELKSKDKTITDLQRQIELLTTKKETADKQKEEYMQAADQATKKYELFKEQIETTSQLVAEKEKTIISITEKLTSADKKIQNYTTLEKEHRDSLDKISKLTNKIAEMEKDFSVNKKELLTEMERKISDIEKDAKLELANAVADKERELMHQITTLEIEKAKLETKLEQFSNLKKDGE